jgi:hypothetical protein
LNAYDNATPKCMRRLLNTKNIKLLLLIHKCVLCGMSKNIFEINQLGNVVASSSHELTYIHIKRIQRLKYISRVCLSGKASKRASRS